MSPARKTDWRETGAGHEAYIRRRAEAQAQANATGYDYGLEANDVYRGLHDLHAGPAGHGFGVKV